MKDSEKICSRLVGFEERAAALYRQLAGRFKENPTLSWFWVEMSMDEKQHAGFLQFCAAEDLIVENLPGPNVIRRLDKLFQKLERRAVRRELSVDDAFLIAAELEKSEIDNIYRRLIGPVPGSWHLLRRKIETTTNGHMHKLLQGARKFGVSAPILAKMTELQDRGHLKAG
jgi:hypothetical protein